MRIENVIYLLIGLTVLLLIYNVTQADFSRTDWFAAPAANVFLILSNIATLVVIKNKKKNS